DPDFKPTKPVLKIEESEFIDRASRRFPRPAADLKQAAREAKHPALRKLYDDLAVPHELLIFKNPDRPRERVKPLDQYVGSQPRGSIDVVPYEAQWKEGKSYAVGPTVL